MVAWINGPTHWQFDPNRPCGADPPTDPFERLHDILAPVEEAWIGCRAEPGMHVDYGQDAELHAQGELGMDKDRSSSALNHGNHF